MKYPIDTSPMQHARNMPCAYHTDKTFAILRAYHDYCMESWIYRLFVKLGLRNNDWYSQ